MAIKFKSLQVRWIIFFWLALLFPLSFVLSAHAANPRTIIISAEGLADPEADTYQHDKGLLIDALREDAKRQAIEKAVGIFVESSTLVENYVLIQDRVITKTKGLIKRVIKESAPWLGKDGFMHILIKAEVYLSDIRDVLKTISREERINLIKDYGNPKISVSVTIRDARRGSHIAPERSQVAENILKKGLKRFGYRVWSEDMSQRLKIEAMERTKLNNQIDTTLSISHLKTADFSIRGEAKFKSVTLTHSVSGFTFTKYILTSWTVKCTDNYTAEEIYFNNKVPQGKSWPDEDAALKDIGRLIANEFTKEFFEEHLMRPTRIFQLQVIGLPNYDIGILLKKEFIGLRPIIKVDLRNFDANALSLYEVEFSGTRGNFLQILNSTVIKPLNLKFGDRTFELTKAQGETARVNFHTEHDINDLLARFENMPPASLATATSERVESLVKDESTMKKVAKINPEAVKKLAQQGNPTANSAINAARDF